MKGRYMSKTEIDRAVALVRGGACLREVSAEVGFSKETVRTHLRRAGVWFEIPGTPWTPGQISELRHLAELRLSVAEIAAALDRPESGVRAKASAIGISIGHPRGSDAPLVSHLQDLSALYRGRSYKTKPTAKRAIAEGYDLETLSLAPVAPVCRELNLGMV